MNCQAISICGVCTPLEKVVLYASFLRTRVCYLHDVVARMNCQAVLICAVPTPLQEVLIYSSFNCELTLTFRSLKGTLRAYETSSAP